MYNQISSRCIPEPVSDNENILADINLTNAGTLSATWTPLSGIPGGLESYYHYVIQMQTMSSSGWGEWQDVLTVDHAADKDIYSETANVTFELNIRYRVRLQVVRLHQNMQEGIAVSPAHLIERVSVDSDSVCRGKWFKWKQKLKISYNILTNFILFPVK